MRNILDTIGNTPLVSLSKIVNPNRAKVKLKLERTNPAGSIKDRPALHIIEDAERRGLLKPGGTLIESSSGNFGISLAMIGAVKGYRVIILVDPKTTALNLAMLRAFGAEVIVVTEQDDSGSYHKTRIALANQLHREIPNSFRPDQCFNPTNSEAHYQLSGPELFAQCNDRVDALVLTVSTGGQAGGFSRFFREHSPATQIIAVDAVGSTIFGGSAHPYLLPGMGLSWTPTNIDDLSRLDEVYKVPDEDAFMACRILARHEGILCGGSSGAALMAALAIADRMSPTETVVCIASDSGERYLPTIYDDAWMQSKGMDLSTSPAVLQKRVGALKPYSRKPMETANYRPDLAQQLGSPNQQVICYA